MDAIYRKTRIITDSFMMRHDTGGQEHPEQSARLAVILERLERSPLPYLTLMARKAESEHVLNVLEGGYHLEALAASVEAYLKGVAVKGKPQGLPVV